MHQQICSCLGAAGLMGNTEAQELYAKACEHVFWPTSCECSPDEMALVWNVPEERRWHPPQERFVIRKNDGRKRHPVKQIVEPLAARPQPVSQKPPAGDEQTEPLVSSQPEDCSAASAAAYPPAHGTQPPPPAPASPESDSQTKKSLADVVPAVMVKKRRNESSGQADESSVVSGEQADESKGQKSMDIITATPAREVEPAGMRDKQESDNNPKMPTHEAMHVFFKQCKESGEALGDSWPMVVDRAVQALAEEAFSIHAPANKLVRLGICICCQTEEDFTNLKTTLPIRLLLNMSVSAYVRVFALVAVHDGPALKWLTEVMACPVATKNLTVVASPNRNWTFPEGYNCIIASAAERGATVANPTDFPKTALSHHAEF